MITNDNFRLVGTFNMPRSTKTNFWTVYLNKPQNMYEVYDDQYLAQVPIAQFRFIDHVYSFIYSHDGEPQD